MNDKISHEHYENVDSQASWEPNHQSRSDDLVTQFNQIEELRQNDEMVANFIHQREELNVGLTEVNDGNRSTRVRVGQGENVNGRSPVKLSRDQRRRRNMQRDLKQLRDESKAT